MQVTHENDHITHAVIGGAQTIEFGVSSSAEFFHILSSTLYTDQKLAVARETVCNAWDAHIDAGKKDIPITVTLTETLLVIRDYGKGIHRDDMGMIYGVYGNSTKKNDGNQTGGFGLGCKSPFAYTDHFEVVSCHDGVKTIYNISKSSAERNGKPGITPIASFPTDDTGLQVSINIKNRADFHAFNDSLRKVIYGGDILADFNGEIVKTLGFDSTKSSFLIAPAITHFPSHLNVRYGNVIYPIPHDSTIENLSHIDTIMQKITRVKGNHALVFQAPPNSISVTPNREAVSLQTHTITTLNGLIKEFLKEFFSKFDKVCKEISRKRVDNCILQNKINRLLTINPLNAQFDDPTDSNTDTKQFQDIVEFSHSYMKHYTNENYPELKEEILYRVKCLIQTKQVNAHLGKMFMEELAKENAPYKRFYSYWSDEQNKVEWVNRYVTAPLAAKLYKLGLPTDKLYVYDSHIIDSSKRDKYGLIPFNKARTGHVLVSINYLKPVIVVGTSRTAMYARVNEETSLIASSHPFYFYQCGMKVAEKEAALKAVQGLGFDVVDITPAIDDGTIKEVKPVKKGIVSLDGLTNLNKRDDDNAVRVLKPEWIVHIPRSHTYSRRFPHYGESITQNMIKLFGNVGGIVTTIPSYDSYIKKGAKHYEAFFLEKSGDYLLASASFKAARENNLKIAISDLEINNGIPNLLCSVPELRNHYRINSPLSDMDEAMLEIFNAVKDSSIKSVQVQEYIKSITPVQHIKALAKKLSKNYLLEFIDPHALKIELTSAATPTSRKQKLINWIIKVIN